MSLQWQRPRRADSRPYQEGLRQRRHRVNQPSLYVFIARSSIHWAAALMSLNLLFAANAACRSPCGFYPHYQFQIQPNFGFLSFIPVCLSSVSVFVLSSPTALTLYFEFAHSQEFFIQEVSGKGWVYFSLFTDLGYCILNIALQTKKSLSLLQGQQILRNSLQQWG